MALCVLAIPASAQQGDGFWLKRVYNQMDQVSKNVDRVKDSQSSLRENLIDLKYAQQQQIKDINYRLNAIEAALKNSNIQSQTRSQRIWDWVMSTVPPLIVALITFWFYEWWKQRRNRQTTGNM